MRNLHIVRHIQQSCKDAVLEDNVCLAVGEDLIFLCSNLKIYLCAGDEIVSTCDLRNEIQHENDNIQIISSTYLSIPRQLCVILDTGEIFCISEDLTTVILQGVCTNELLAAQFSPDEELLVLVTNVNSVILMNSLYDIIITMDLHEKSFGEKEFINVGWGKKETQFHGSEGKDAARAKLEFDVKAPVQTESKACVTWRGDGALFAVSYLLQTDLATFKVYSREGILQFTGEKQPGIENNLSWRLSGNLLATTQIFPNKYVVAFFEKNGLKHGEFSLPFLSKDFKVVKIAWSGDSESLAVHCQNLSDFTSKILIYTMSNYHWYLKQSLYFHSHCDVKTFTWDYGMKLGDGKKIFILTLDGFCHIYNWKWGIDHSKGHSELDQAVVGVIDGKKLLLTDFRNNVTPPPMSSCVLSEDENINGVIFGPCSTIENNTLINSNSICIIREDGSLVFYRKKSEKILQYDKIGILNMENKFSLWTWREENVLLCAQTLSKKVSILHLVKVKFPQTLEGENILSCNIIKTIEIDYFVTSIQNIMGSDHTLLQCDNGNILNYNIKDNQIESVLYDNEKQFINYEGIVIGNDIFVFGLTERNRFFVNNIEVADNITSFYVHSDFLLLTNLQHNILCTELSKEGITGLQTFKDSEKSCVSQRKIERGAKLVIVVPKDTRTVLQMPRGNLEVIQPRSLSLKLIGFYLDNCRYFDAFDLMRKQRINLNLMYDHSPSEFTKNVNEFINNINNNTWLSLFLSELDEEDVTKTMYSSSYFNSCNNKANNNGINKVIHVCTLIRKAIENHADSQNKMIPILTSYVKINTIVGLENALLIVKQLKDNEISSSSNGGIKADEALKYLQYLVHIDKLYDTALGMYDFDLVLFVASKSQKDPREYIPFLNELNTLDENYRKYTIDKHLKRYDSALRHLCVCGEERESEILPFVKQHNLYKESLQMFDKNDKIYIKIGNYYGHSLKLTKHFSEAGFVYKKCGNLEEAVECFKESSEWEVAIQLSKQLDWQSQRSVEFYWSLVRHLQQNNKYSAALHIMEFFIKDIKAAIGYAAEVQFFRAAIRLCCYEGYNDYLVSTVQPAAINRLADISRLINQLLEQFSQQKERLNVVRLEKAKNKANLKINDEDISDLYSDTSSTTASSASRTSSRSFRSSKNRRKHERKLVSLKEGSRYEDIALVRSLHNLVTSAFKMREDVFELCFTLHYFDQNKISIDLQNSLDNLLETMKLNYSNIWTSDLTKTPENNLENDLDIDSDALTTLEPHIRIPPVTEDIKWKMHALT